MTTLNFSDQPIKLPQFSPGPTVVASGADVSALENAVGTAHRTVATDTAIAASDSVVFVDASAGSVTITLPALSQRRFTIKKVDATGNTVIISGAASVDGNASIGLNTQYESLTLGGGNSEWFIL